MPALKSPRKEWKSRVPDDNAPQVPIPIIQKGPAYRTRAPVQSEKGEQEIVSKILSSPVTVTTRDLMDISPGVREQVKKNVTKRRIKEVQKEIEDAFENALFSDLGNYADLYDLNEDDDEDHVLAPNAINIETLPEAKVFTLEREQGGLPAGAVICDDPVLAFLQDFDGEEVPELYVAKESNSLRTIYPVINGVSTSECVLDGGSQIVSMDKDIAVELKIPWDPDIKIFMQSANKQVERTVGLARNVPFRFNDITIYLQVHIIKNPAYNVLLGRPFDTLTKSSVQNYEDGGQLVTITDPNTGRRCTLSTFEKGRSKRLLGKPKVEQDFQSSMN